MTKNEALHKALKVLNCLNNDRVYETAWVKGAINACEEALEQSSQDYVLICKRCGDDLGLEYVPDEQPAQQPVAWQWLKSGHMRKKIPKTETLEHWRPLYTHPHQWQGLTDDEIGKLFDAVMDNDKASTEFFGIEYAHAIEQALKEKNHGN